uniref:Epstein-Barr virus EBNA-1-like n=1 Tax=Oryza sativa subsp. japonica TaxID=39947 RepID=Q655Z1_ORYSJ|nr:Epstein-Barr virus EBNA-1-like [Oryza sativa Japonica Group]
MLIIVLLFLLKQDFKEISKDEYFAKNNEFATWSKEEKGKFFSDLSLESARDLFEKFVKTWNKGKLPSQYYEGITRGPRWVLQIAGEEASMKDRFVSPHRQTANRSHAIKNTGTLVCSPHAMSEVILHLSPPQKKAIEVSGLGNLLKINKIHIYRDLCNEIARSYDKEKKAFNINGTFVTMTLDDVDCLLGLPSKGDEIFEAPKINKPELFNLYKKEGQTTITLEALRVAIINSSSYDDHFIRRFILFSIGSFICLTTQRYVRSGYLNLVDDVDKMRELNWSSLTLNQLLKGILKFREKETNIEGNVCLLQIWYWEKLRIDKLAVTIYHSGRERQLIQYWDKIKEKKRLFYLFGKGQVVDDIRGTIDCKEIPNENAHDNDSETRTNEDFVCTSEEVHSIISTEQSADITLQERIQESIQTLQDNFNDFTKDFWPRMRALILDCMENDSKCPERKDTTHVFEDVEQEQIDPREHVSNHNEEYYINQNENMTCETKDNSNQSNQSRKRLTGPTGRTYKPTNRTDFIYETRGKKKDIIRTQAQTKKTIVYIEKEDLTQQIIDNGPPKNALRELTKKEDPFITYINNTEDNKVMVHIEQVEVKWIRMKVLTQPEFLNDDVMDAYIQCLRYKVKGIRGDGKAFLEMAIKISLLNVEGVHVEASKPRNKRWIRDMARGYLAFDMVDGDSGGVKGAAVHGEENVAAVAGGSDAVKRPHREPAEAGGGAATRRDSLEKGAGEEDGDGGGSQAGAETPPEEKAARATSNGLRRREAADSGGGGEADVDGEVLAG